nr:MAG TPA: hypothetical protein [Bacteriophage sp.]
MLLECCLQLLHFHIIIFHLFLFFQMDFQH